MTFLPVVERELRAASRRGKTYWWRTLTALLTLGIFTWGWLLSAQSALQHERAQAIFAIISGLAFAYALLAGPGATADSLSEEKREGTLGLLFLTDLKGYDVVLGKLAATSLDTFYRLLAVLPVLAIPILMGGLTAAEFWRMLLVLVNTLFFSLTAGVLVSSMSRQSQKAVSGAFGLVLLVAGGLPLGGLIWQAWQPSHQYHRGFLLGSPGFGYALSFDSSYRLHAREFWTCVGVSHLFGWLHLTLASIILPRVWQDRPVVKRASGWKERFHAWRFGVGTARMQFRMKLLELNPFCWLASRERRKPHYVLILLGGAALVWLGLAWRFPHEMIEPITLFLTAILTHSVVKFWVAMESCRQVAEDRRSNALELLLSTSLSVPEILRGQMLALHRQFFAPSVVVLGLYSASLLVGSLDRSAGGSTEWALLCLSFAAVFVADLCTLAWVGMWLGLTAKSAQRATGGAILRVLVLPWFVYLGFLTVFVTSSFSQSSDSGVLLIAVGLIIGLANDFLFHTSARRNLLEKFRLVATQRFGSTRPDAVAADRAPAQPGTTEPSSAAPGVLSSKSL